jgi:hypothetical protein
MNGPYRRSESYSDKSDADERDSSYDNFAAIDRDMILKNSFL